MFYKTDCKKLILFFKVIKITNLTKYLIFCFLGKSATFLEVDHEAHRVYVEEIQMIPLDQGIEVMRPSDDTIASRLSAPIVSFDIDTKKISFERYSMNIL